MMTLDEFVEMFTPDTKVRVVVKHEGKYYNVGNYESAKAQYGDRPVLANEVSYDYHGEDGTMLRVPIESSLWNIGARLNEVIKSYDSYGHADAGLDVRECVFNITQKPVDTIEYLLSIIEDLMDD